MLPLPDISRAAQDLQDGGEPAGTPAQPPSTSPLAKPLYVDTPISKEPEGDRSPPRNVFLISNVSSLAVREVIGDWLDWRISAADVPATQRDMAVPILPMADIFDRFGILDLSWIAERRVGSQSARIAEWDWRDMVTHVVRGLFTIVDIEEGVLQVLERVRNGS